MLEAHRDIIMKELDAIGVKVKRLAKSSLGDGWYVYHDYAPVNATPQYKYTVISQSDGKTAKLREKRHIRVSFISDCDDNDFTDSLAMNITETKHMMS
jgi:hypothetical protein